MPAGTPSVTSLDSGGHVPLTKLGGRTPPIDYAVSYCFGLRLIKVGYSGPLIRLRRASDDAESDFFSIRGFLDTASIATFLGGSDGFARTLYDQSGNGRDAVQALADEQPKYIASHNGRPALLYDAIDDLLRRSGYDLAQPLEVSWVWQSASQGLEYFFDAVNVSKRCVGYIDTGGDLAMYAGVVVTTPTDLTDDNTHYTNIQFAGAASILRHDGAEELTGDLGALSQDGLTLGARYSDANFYDGHLYEFIVSAGGLLSVGERAALEADQAAFYGVP